MDNISLLDRFVLLTKESSYPPDGDVGLANRIITTVREHDQRVGLGGIREMSDREADAIAAHEFLDLLKVPRGDSAGPFSLSGRIRHSPAVAGPAEIRGGDGSHKSDLSSLLGFDQAALAGDVRRPGQVASGRPRAAVPGSGVDRSAAAAVAQSGAGDGCFSHAITPTRPTALDLARERGSTPAELRMECLRLVSDRSHSSTPLTSLVEGAKAFAAFVLGEK